MTMYRQEIIDRYRFPRHRGALNDADVQGEVMNALCGDDLTLFLLFDARGARVKQAAFAGQGCALMTASADLVCEYLIGKTRGELAEVKPEHVLALFGEAPSPSRLKCVLLPFEALKRGISHE